MKNSISNSPPGQSIATWLFACCGLVFSIVIVGAITRLTESGLSITEWKPLIGALPPLNHEQWNDLFNLYKQTPEFQKKNFWMELPDFQRIFFWEWFHRLLGRLIGLAYALPLMWFWIRGKIPQGYKLKLLGILVLGGLQGAMGWYMVKSGLVDRPSVSHFRLAAHLGLAFLLYSTMLWLGLSLSSQQIRKTNQPLFTHAFIVLLFALITITWGAFTAGLDAGLIYNETFPMMGDVWIPPEAYTSILNNPAGVQFLHRWLAIATVLMITGFWIHALKRKSAFPIIHALMVMGMIQAGLGIATLLSGVFLSLAVLHQAGALVTLTLLLMTLHRLR